MGDFLIIPCLNCIKISQKQAWRPLIFFAWMKSIREYVIFKKYFCILGVSHLKEQNLCATRTENKPKGLGGTLYFHLNTKHRI